MEIWIVSSSGITSRAPMNIPVSAFSVFSLFYSVQFKPSLAVSVIPTGRSSWETFPETFPLVGFFPSCPTSN